MINTKGNHKSILGAKVQNMTLFCTVLGLSLVKPATEVCYCPHLYLLDLRRSFRIAIGLELL